MNNNTKSKMIAKRHAHCTPRVEAMRKIGAVEWIKLSKDERDRLAGR